MFRFRRFSGLFLFLTPALTSRMGRIHEVAAEAGIVLAAGLASLLAVPRMPGQSTPDPPLVRKDFSKLTAAEKESLRKAFEALFKLDKGKFEKDKTTGKLVYKTPIADKDLNPLGWTYQAYIHGTPAGVANSRIAWDSCEHSSWYFLSWHRWSFTSSKEPLERSSATLL